VWGWCIPNPKNHGTSSINSHCNERASAPPRVVELTIELPDSKLKSLIVDGEIDVHKYIDVDIRNNFKSDFKRCEVSDLTIDVDDPTISSWETTLEERRHTIII
jgi:hypothetical protein